MHHDKIFRKRPGSLNVPFSLTSPDNWSFSLRPLPLGAGLSSSLRCCHDGVLSAASTPPLLLLADEAHEGRAILVADGPLLAASAAAAGLMSRLTLL